MIMNNNRWTYDTEFHEDGKTIDFISIGMVSLDTGKEYYAVSNEFDTRRVAKNNWLMDNVMSSIEHEKFVVQDFEGAQVVRDIFVTDKAAKSRLEIAADIYELTCHPTLPRPEFWAWFSAYDHVCLAQLWGRMIDLPPGMTMRTNDIGTLVDLAGNPKIPKQPNGLHNALDDARHNVVRYEYLMGMLRG